jgi:zinc transport system substrate-binding protein
MKKKIIILLTIVLIFASAGFAGGTPETSPVMATTSWTAAFADLAGVENATVLAPYEMKHPAEYELKPTDIQALGKAEIIIFAGYEVMLSKIKENAGNESTQLVQIKTIMNYPMMSESAMIIAKAAGTEEKAQKNLAKMKTTLDQARETLKKEGLFGKRVIVHFHQKALIEELGFEVAAVYGPGPLEAKQIGELSKVKTDLIIDNWHNPVSQPLAEIFPDLKRPELINFPGKDNTKTLFDVIDYNIDQLIK